MYISMLQERIQIFWEILKSVERKFSKLTCLCKLFLSRAFQMSREDSICQTFWGIGESLKAQIWVCYSWIWGILANTKLHTSSWYAIEHRKVCITLTILVRMWDLSSLTFVFFYKRAMLKRFKSLWLPQRQGLKHSFIVW